MARLSQKQDLALRQAKAELEVVITEMSRMNDMIPMSEFETSAVRMDTGKPMVRSLRYRHQDLNNYLKEALKRLEQI